MDYLKLLDESYIEYQHQRSERMSKLEYLADNIFNFITYDSQIDDLFAEKALKTCLAITNRTTFDLCHNENAYEWYLIMVNMPFFQKKLTWGTSIRGAWWDFYSKDTFSLNSCGIYIDGKQFTDELFFDNEDWDDFIRAMDSYVYDF